MIQPVLGHIPAPWLEARSANTPGWMNGPSFRYTTARSDQPDTDLLRSLSPREWPLEQCR
jgi:hypothetical protein